MSDLSKFADGDIIDIVSSDGEAELRKRGYVYGWHKRETHVGAIYILVNPAFANLVKIGYADDVQKRLNSINGNSALPTPFHCYATYGISRRLGDKKLHKLIDTLNPALRYAKNREFYEMDCQKAFEILSAIAQINGYDDRLTLNPFSDPFFDKQSAKSPNESGLHASGSGKKPNITFGMLGIPVGSTLVFVDDENIACVTMDDVNKVVYKNKVYTTTGLAKKLLHKKKANGPKSFKYNGETLREMRARLGL